MTNYGKKSFEPIEHWVLLLVRSLSHSFLFAILPPDIEDG